MERRIDEVDAHGSEHNQDHEQGQRVFEHFEGANLCEAERIGAGNAAAGEDEGEEGTHAGRGRKAPGVHARRYRHGGAQGNHHAGGAVVGQERRHESGEHAADQNDDEAG